LEFNAERKTADHRNNGVFTLAGSADDAFAHPLK